MQRWPKFRAVVFDWNGTLLNDTVRCYEGGAKAVFVHFGINPPTFEEYRQNAGKSAIEEFYQSWGIKASREEINAIFHFGVEKAAPADLSPGSRMVLRRLRDWRIPCALLSLFNEEMLLQDVDSFKLTNFFCCNGEILIYGSLKEKTTRLLELREKFGCGPKELVLISDTSRDILDAKKAECFAIAYSGGVESPKSLRKAQPDLMIDNLWDVIFKTPLKKNIKKRR